MAKIQTGLGRGLEALISDAAFLKSNHDKSSKSDNALLNTAEIEIDKIEPNPYQPRTEFNQESIEELAASIKAIGLIQPITVRPINGGRYQIISGERMILTILSIKKDKTIFTSVVILVVKYVGSYFSTCRIGLFWIY